MPDTWRHGHVIVRREITWGRPCLAVPVYVVEDRDDLFATYLPAAAPFSYGDVEWPTPTGRHPWWPREAWEGHGVLMLQRPGDAYAVWHFWVGDDRDFGCWYVNLQDPFRRTSIGYDTEDHELDVVVQPSGEWSLKDEDQLEQRLREGRYSEAQGRAIRLEGQRITAMLDAGIHWWERSWTEWSPHPSWVPPPPAPAGWEQIPW